VGTGGKRGASTGVRVSAKRCKSPLKLTAEQVAEVFTTREFRDQLLVFMDAGLGVRRGELAALRWRDCDFEQRVFDIQHSYYWRHGGHLVDTKSEAPAYRPLTSPDWFGLNL
jgi:integrase